MAGQPRLRVHRAIYVFTRFSSLLAARERESVSRLLRKALLWTTPDVLMARLFVWAGNAFAFFSFFIFRSLLRHSLYIVLARDDE